MLFSWSENKSIFSRPSWVLCHLLHALVGPQLNGRQRDAKSELTSRTNSCTLLSWDSLSIPFRLSPYLGACNSGMTFAPVSTRGRHLDWSGKALFSSHDPGSKHRLLRGTGDLPTRTLGASMLAVPCVVSGSPANPRGKAGLEGEETQKSSWLRIPLWGSRYRCPGPTPRDSEYFCLSYVKD